MSGQILKSTTPKNSSHLDNITSAAHDNDIRAINRGKKSKLTIACGAILLFTLFYVAKQFSYMTKHHVSSSLSIQYDRKTALYQDESDLPSDSIYRAELTDIYNKTHSLFQYAGLISLVVNVACEWGLTESNYKELAVLHNKYSKRGFTVLAFPSNDFDEENRDNEGILSFVQENFPEVNFPLFSKGPLETNVVFQLCEKQTQEKVEWNFHKYLVDRSGRAVKSYENLVQPIDIEEDIVRLLENREVTKAV